ncbi:MAG: TIGR02266 family protein [Polyangiales bacterium]
MEDVQRVTQDTLHDQLAPSAEGAAPVPPLPDAQRQPQPSDPADRRRAPRVGYSTEVSLESVDNFYTGFTEDISEGGLFLSTYDLQPMGTEVVLNFSLPNGVKVEVVGIVRWLRDTRDAQDGVPPGMGVQFTNMSPEDEEAIQSFVHQRDPMFYAD